MSEVQARPAATRGRGSAVRGGRGGFSSRGGRNPSRSANTNGDAKHEPEVTALPTLDDPEVAHLKDAYGTKLPIVKELFPDWSDVDILYGLQETDGDEALTVERIADGTLLFSPASLSPLPQPVLSSRPSCCPPLCLLLQN